MWVPMYLSSGGLCEVGYMCKNNIHGAKHLIIPPHSHTSVTVKFNTTKAISLGYTAHFYIVHFMPVDICSTMCQQSMIPFVGIIDLFQAESTPGTPLFIHCIEKVRNRESVLCSFHHTVVQHKPGLAPATLDP